MRKSTPIAPLWKWALTKGCTSRCHDTYTISPWTLPYLPLIFKKEENDSMQMKLPKVVEHLYLSGMWFGVGPRMDIRKTCV